MLHLPILRQGVPYKSLDVVTVPHYRTREPFVEISQANAVRPIPADLSGAGDPLHVAPHRGMRHPRGRRQLQHVVGRRLSSVATRAAACRSGRRSARISPEGHLFEHLYAWRSFQQHADAALATAGEA